MDVSEHSPHLITAFSRTFDGAMCGIKRYVMTKLPGVFIHPRVLDDRATYLRIASAFVQALE